ncbi:MAG: GtrA family protein [Candidatus Doudnabacteria bacterium]|nr:GtrA family protein [Candidatus Doudnabacteria bacterium]
MIGQFLRFAIVGGINTATDFIALFILSAITGVEKGEKVIILNLISFSIAVVVSYFLNKHWTFRDTSADDPKKFTLFLTVSVIGAGVNSLIVYLVSTYVPEPTSLLASLSSVSDTGKLWLGVAKLAATVASLIWNFIGYKFLVFKK